MKVIHKQQTEKFQNSALCTAIEYPLGDKDIDGSIIELAGRYPEEGRVMNFECKELSYVISGSGKVVVEGREVNLQEGDSVLIESGEKYFWDGRLTMFVSCNPAWHPEQHKKIG